MVYIVGVHESTRPLGLAFNIGMRLPAHLTATGKAMLAFLDPAAVRALMPRGPLPALEGRRALRWADFAAELALTRERGFSIDDGGVREGVYAVAAPVFNASGQPVAAIAACSSRSARGAAQQERQCRRVVQAAQRLSQRLGAPAHPHKDNE